MKPSPVRDMMVISGSTCFLSSYLAKNPQNNWVNSANTRKISTIIGKYDLFIIKPAYFSNMEIAF